MSQPLAFVIEDDEVIAKIFATAVSSAEFDTVVIRDGIDAMKQLDSVTPDFVLLDLHLPGISGINILHLIRNTARFEKTRILIVSADATQSEFLRLHADQVLIKPIGFHKIREAALLLRPN